MTVPYGRLWDITACWSNYRFWQWLPLFNCIVRGEPLESSTVNCEIWSKTRNNIPIVLCTKYVDIVNSLGVKHQCDRRTDRLTDRFAIAVGCLDAACIQDAGCIAPNASCIAYSRMQPAYVRMAAYNGKMQAECRLRASLLGPRLLRSALKSFCWHVLFNADRWKLANVSCTTAVCMWWSWYQWQSS